MKFFVTGVGGQLGHDVMNELLKRGHEGVGSDIQESYSGVADDSAVTKAPYVALDITDKNAVEKVITEVNPDAVIHCAAWTAVDMAEDDDKVAKVRAINAGGTQNIANVWSIWETVNGEQKLTTECIENVIMMVPFSAVVMWTFEEKVGHGWKKKLWQSSKIAFIFSVNIEMLQLLLRLGTFQLSDILYNTVGGVVGGLVYYATIKARKRL